MRHRAAPLEEVRPEARPQDRLPAGAHLRLPQGGLLRGRRGELREHLRVHPERDGVRTGLPVHRQGLIQGERG